MDRQTDPNSEPSKESKEARKAKEGMSSLRPLVSSGTPCGTRKAHEELDAYAKTFYEWLDPEKKLAFQRDYLGRRMHSLPGELVGWATAFFSAVHWAVLTASYLAGL